MSQSAARGAAHHGKEATEVMDQKSATLAGGTCEGRPDKSSPPSEQQSGTNSPSHNPSSTAVREALPARRGSTVFEFRHGGQSYLATISYFPGSARLAEVFIDAAKPGSAIAEHANDAAVLASLLLQHGVPAEKIRHSISGPLATALAIAERDQ